MYFLTLLVFVCSFMYGLSAVLCKYGLQQDTELRSYSPRSIFKFLITSKIWLLGVLLSFATNIAIVELQSILDVSVVYPILNFSYIFVLLLGYLFLRESLNRQQWIGVALVTLGTLLIIFIDSPTTGEGTDVQALVLISSISVLSIGAIIFTVHKHEFENYEIAYAICTGIALGNVETYLKANTNLVITEFGHFSIFSLESVYYFFSLWPFFVLVFVGVVGWICMQITYSHGNVSVTVPLFAVIQSVFTLCFGYLVFGEYFGIQKIIGVLTIISGVMAVIFSSANDPEVEPA